MLSVEKLKDFFSRNRIFLVAFIGGFVLIGLGILLTRNVGSTKVEVLEATTEGFSAGSEIVVEIAGEVEKPGVYKLAKDARIEDLLVISGGVSSTADREWIEKFLNRAAKLIDGQKLYIPTIGEQSKVSSANNTVGNQTVSPNFSGQGSGLINVNAATLKELDSLPGIGPVYGQNIIEHRPYSNIEELLSKGVLKKSVYEKIKNLIIAY